MSSEEVIEDNPFSIGVEFKEEISPDKCDVIGVDIDSGFEDKLVPLSLSLFSSDFEKKELFI
jgi:hypothetical protein